MPKIVTFKEFLERANKIHNNKYDYSKAIYTVLNSKIEIICPIHGNFWQRGQDHYRGQGCSICGNKRTSNSKIISFDNFLKKAILKHKNYYKYNEENFNGITSKITISCPKHGKFQQTGKNHLKGHGCKKCSMEKRLLLIIESNNFIEKALKIHNNYYSYEKTNFINVNTKVIITCPFHGDFKQTPTFHCLKKSPQGCNLCGKERSKKYSKDNPIGWNLTSWIKGAEKSKTFDSFKVYIIKCWNQNEEFYKIGRTYRPLKLRFVEIKRNYQIEIIKVIEGDAEKMYKMEIKLKKEHKIFKYLPKIKFDGVEECFSKIIF